MEYFCVSKGGVQSLSYMLDECDAPGQFWILTGSSYTICTSDKITLILY